MTFQTFHRSNSQNQDQDQYNRNIQIPIRLKSIISYILWTNRSKKVACPSVKEILSKSVHTFSIVW